MMAQENFPGRIIEINAGGECQWCEMNQQSAALAAQDREKSAALAAQISEDCVASLKNLGKEYAALLRVAWETEELARKYRHQWRILAFSVGLVIFIWFVTQLVQKH